MFKIILLLFCVCGVYSYFTLPGECPENVHPMEDFNLLDFLGKWYQAYYYASDDKKKNNCSTIKIEFCGMKNGITLCFNQSRVDRDLFYRYSVANIPPPPNGTTKSNFHLEFEYENAPRTLKTREYQFQVLATNYTDYATAYTCQYSSLINKHFIYIWILSRNPILDDVPKELALKPLQQIGIEPDKLVRDDQSKCQPKYFDNLPTEPTTFNYPVERRKFTAHTKFTQTRQESDLSQFSCNCKCTKNNLAFNITGEFSPGV